MHINYKEKSRLPIYYYCGDTKYNTSYTRILFLNVNCRICLLLYLNATNKDNYDTK